MDIFSDFFSYRDFKSHVIFLQNVNTTAEVPCYIGAVEVSKIILWKQKIHIFSINLSIRSPNELPVQVCKKNYVPLTRGAVFTITAEVPHRLAFLFIILHALSPSIFSRKIHPLFCSDYITLFFLLHLFFLLSPLLLFSYLLFPFFSFSTL